ncbi:MAG: D-alanyl-D-alanine carboxypeptidase/D-alanyl-D-alanine-endopeptidase [Ignavibacteria bacterium]|nr:D-alanyl-D-alanine carboxypeptidase/D-alanyl-D-alanine-endopeptidase [Ignavibacteria bacterium]
MKKVILITTILLFSEILYPQTLQEKIDNFLANVNLKNTKTSISIFSVKENKFIYERNSTELLNPASTIKIFTTGIALLYLGEDYKIKTEFYSDDDNLNDGIINGNLLVKGFGDPKLSMEDLFALVQKLKQKGINRITKSIIVDDSFFDEILYRDEWIEDEGRNVSLPPICALSLNKNSIAISVTGSSKLRAKPGVSFSPECDYFKIINNARSTGKRLSIKITIREIKGKEEIYISGSIPRNRNFNTIAHVKNPPAFLGSILKKYLQNVGIKFEGDILLGKISKFSNRIVYHELALTDLIKDINKYSNNYYAEYLFKIIGANYSGEFGGAFDATRAIFSFLKSNKLYENDMSIVDGSGISRTNLISTRNIVQFLSHIYSSKDEFEPFVESLPIAGIDGTMRNRMLNTCGYSNCRAKTGTLRGITSIAGYIFNKPKSLFIFAMNFVSENHSADYFRDVQDRIIQMICDAD